MIRRIFAPTLGLVLTCTVVSAEPGGAAVDRLLNLWIPDTLELCGETVPLDRPEVLERLDLELVVTLGDPVSATMWFKRAPRYLPRVEAALARRGLPDDLKYVPLIESNLRAGAVSYAGAVGPWQIMSATGRGYGLETRSWREDRKDWEAATLAALDHLGELREHFGSWPLALAAYNAGRRRVASAMKKQGEAEFYGLRLPRETERYVFRLMAAKLLMEYPTAYGIGLEGARLYGLRESGVVDLEVERRRLPVAAVADAAEMPYRELVEANPWMTGRDLPRGLHRVRVPADSVDVLPERLARWRAAHPEPERVYYRVRRGDTLGAIARRHSVRLRQLLSWNGLTSKSIIRPGQNLVVLLTD